MSIVVDHTPPVKLHEVTPPRVTLKCMDRCGVMVRVYNIEPATAIGAYRYCPVCGSSNVSAYMSAETNQWEALARDYGLPIPVIQQLYKLWVPSHHHRFADFVHELREDIRTGRLDEIEAERNARAHELQEKARRATITAPMPKLKVPTR